MKLIAPRFEVWRYQAAIRLLLAGFFFLQATALPLAAQEATGAETPAQEVTTQPGPAAIPATAILARGEETEALLTRVALVMQPDPEIEALATALQSEREILDGYRSELDLIDRRTVSERTLSDQRERWQRSEVRLQAWLETLRGRWQELIELRDEAQFEQQIWSQTRDSLVDSGLGQEVLDSIDTIAILTDDALAALGPRIEDVTELMNRASRRVADVTEAFAEIDELATEIRARLFRRDAPPLWRAPVIGAAALAGEVSGAAAYWWRTASEWSIAHYGQLLVLALVFAGLLASTLATRRLKRSWPNERRFDAAVFVVSRPVAIAALGTLGASAFILNPITGPVQDVLRLVGLAAIMRLGQGLSAPLPRPTFHGLMFLYLSVVLHGFVPDGALGGRLLLLAMAGAGSVVSYRAFRAWPRDAGLAWRFARGGTLIAAALFLLGGAANVLGWVDLATILVKATITSALAALGWMILLRAIAGVLPLLHTGLVGANLESIRQRQRQFARAIMVPMMTMAGYGWLAGALRSFGVFAQARDAVDKLLGWSFGVGGLEISAGGILGAIAILIVTAFVARVVRFILSEEIFPRLQIRPGTVSTLVSLINYAIITIGIVLGATAAGFNTTQLTVVLGAMSVGIGFGLQAVVGNFVSGLILMFERPVSVGDQVEAAGFLGKITHIGIRASRLHTFDGSDVIIPNSDLVTRQVVNWTLQDGLKRVNLDLEVGLDSDPRTVMETLASVAAAHELVLEEPPPRALMRGYGDSSINFRLQVWLRVENALSVPSDLHLALIERLRAAGVEVPAVRRERHDTGAAE